ncbi:MAG: hypothetical protein ACD_75C02045G0001, partial [uncultured bacterium]
MTDRWEDINGRAIEHLRHERYEEALQEALVAAACAESEFGAVHPNVAVSYHNLGEIHRLLGSRGQAETSFGKSLSLYEAINGPDSGEVADGLVNLAALDLEQGRLDQAEPKLRRALAIAEKSDGPTSAA